MRYRINFCFLLAGTTLGILVCLNVFGPCVTPLTDICKHTFWDWMLRVFEVFATISAVIVAVFKEEIRKKLFRPHISFNSNTELIENVAKMEGRCFATSYSAMMTLRNDGKNTATNLSVVIENIIYKRDVNGQIYQKINQEPLPMPIYRGEEAVNLFTDDEISFKLFELFGPQNQIINGKSYNTPMSFIIGKKTIPESNFDGIIEISIKIKCSELKSQYRKIRLEWNGKWEERLTEMSRILCYQWIPCEKCKQV